MKKHQIKRKKAFTLVELIIVITILAVLATVAFISFQNFTKDARDGNRISTLKSVYSGLQIYNTKSGKYPNPDYFTDIVGVSNQGYAGENISSIIKVNKLPKDPLDATLYTYSTSKDNKKIQLSTYLEKGNILQLSQINLLSQVYGSNIIDYSNRILYTYGDNVGILIDNQTKAPVQEIYGTGTIDLQTNTGTYIVKFSNNSTNSGSIEGSGISLLTQINTIQNSCLLGNTTLLKGQTKTAYNTSSVPFGNTCQSIQRTCGKGLILSGDNNYKFDTCNPVSGANCSDNSEYNGYNIPNINHNETKEVLKDITNGKSSINVNCFNGVLSYGNENINCGDYVYDDELKTCNENLCKDNHLKPTYSQLNGTQKYGISWSYNTDIGYCHFVCQEGYHWENNDCLINTYTVSGNISNGNGATINICGKTTTADSSGNFSIVADYNTNCSNLEIIRESYNCSVDANGPLNLVNNINNISGSCIMSNFIFNKIININTTNYNIKLDAISAGWDGNIPLIATITINTGIYVGSSSTSSYAFDTGTGFPTGSSLKLINNGYIIGAGGSGGTAACYRTGYGTWQNGKNGGHAIIAQYPITITNNNIIGGGGGGGGGGDDRLRGQVGDGGGGGGGAGYTVGAAGAGSNGGGAGNPGTYTSGGTGGRTTINNVTGGVGGTGGALGTNGGYAANGGYAVGGAGGKAVVGNSYITWVATGTRYGAINN